MNKVVVKCRARQTTQGFSGEVMVETEHSVMLAPVGHLLAIDGSKFVPTEQDQDALLRCLLVDAEDWFRHLERLGPGARDLPEVRDAIAKVRAGELVAIVTPSGVPPTLEPRDHVLGEFREVLVMRDGRVVLDG